MASLRTIRHARSPFSRRSVSVRAMRVLTLLVALAGCAPSVVSSNPRNVTVDNVGRGNLAEASEIAQAECETYGRDAEQITGLDATERNQFTGAPVTFKCVHPAPAVMPA